MSQVNHKVNREVKQWGILGTSFISGVMAAAIRQDGQSKIYAVAGRSPEREMHWHSSMTFQFNMTAMMH